MSLCSLVQRLLLLASFLLSSCAAVSPSPPTLTSLSPKSSPTPPSISICDDPAVLGLIDSLKVAIDYRDGALLVSLVSPDGWEVRYYRHGNAVRYTPEETLSLFESVSSVQWGLHPASGLETQGAFREVVLPPLTELFSASYTLHCNDLQHGGANYEVTWPYHGDFYAIYFAGSEENGFLDWRTWAVGVKYHDSRPYLYALVQYFWEP